MYRSSTPAETDKKFYVVFYSYLAEILMKAHLKIKEILREYDFIFLLGAFISFTLSLYVGTLEGEINLYLWGIFAVIGIFCVYKAFPDVWHYSLWILTLYALGGSGAFLISQGERESIYYAAGTACEILGVYILALFFKRIVWLRNKGIEHVSLGIWFILIIIFYALSNLSLFDLGRWLNEDDVLDIYIASEVFILIIALYALWFLQSKFGEIARLERRELEKLIVEPVEAGKREKPKEIRIPKATKLSKCPVCNSDLVIEKKICPNCKNKKTVGWCKVSEYYIINCPHCTEPTPYGEDCVMCGKPLEDTLECSYCKKSYPITKWSKEK